MTMGPYPVWGGLQESVALTNSRTFTVRTPTKRTQNLWKHPYGPSGSYLDTKSR